MCRHKPIADKKLVKAANRLDLGLDPIGIKQRMRKKANGSTHVSAIDRELKTTAVFEK